MGYVHKKVKGHLLLTFMASEQNTSYEKGKGSSEF